MSGWPENYIQLQVPQIDKGAPSLGEQLGRLPASLSDWYTYKDNEPFPGPNISSGNVGNNFASIIIDADFGGAAAAPIVVPSPWAYDDAGYPIDANTLLCISSADHIGAYNRLNGTPGVYDLIVLNKHLFPFRIKVFGIPPGTTGTIQIGHNPDYVTGVPPSIIDKTWNFDGANGPTDEGMLESAISIDPTLRLKGNLYIFATWSGAAPTSVFYTLTNNTFSGTVAQGVSVSYGRLIPNSLTPGFTARNDHDQNHGGYKGTQSRKFPCAVSQGPNLVSPGNWRFLRASNVQDPWQTPNRSQGGGANGFGTRFRLNTRFLGDPDYHSSTDEPVSIRQSYLEAMSQCVWIGNDLYRHTYESRAYGTAVFTTTIGVAAGGNPGGTYTSTSAMSAVFSRGPGWVNCRCWLFAPNPAGVSFTINYIKIFIYIDGILINTVTITSGFPMTSGEPYFDSGVCYPSSPTDFGELTVKGEIQITVPPGPFSGGYSVGIMVKASPRRDLSLPTTIVGPNNECAPGGYLPAFLGTPGSLGGIQHLGPGVTSYVWPALATNEAASEALTFLIPSDGVWKVQNAASPTQTITLGEFEYVVTGRSSALGRAGKRFWAWNEQSQHTATNAWNLSSVAQVQTAIPGSGLSILSGHITDDNWFFGTIALPAAGNYKIQAVGSPYFRRNPANSRDTNIGASLILAAHSSDPYVIIPETKSIHDPLRLGVIPDPTPRNTPPGSPVSGDTYFIGSAPTGVWAGLDEGTLVMWDDDRAIWFVRPIHEGFRYFYVTGEGPSPYVSGWFNGSQWKADTDPICEITVHASAATTIYIRCGYHDPYLRAISDTPLVWFKSVTLSWAAI